MHVKVNRLYSFRKGKLKNEVFFIEIMQAPEPKPHVSQKEGQPCFDTALEDGTPTKVDTARL